MSPQDIIQADGDLFANVPGVASAQGVALNAPPPAIFADVMQRVTDTVQAMPEGSKVALVGIATETNGVKNVNLALAIRAGTHVEIVTWLGKTWGAPVDKGVALRWHF